MKNIGLIVIQGDAFLQNKVIQIVENILNNDFDIIDYEFKSKFSEAEKEEMYLLNLNSKKNVWWFSKETFELGSSLALIVSSKNIECENIFNEIKHLKGSSCPQDATYKSIRSKFDALCTAYNLLHASDNEEEFAKESRIFFSDQRISNFTKVKIDTEYIYRELNFVGEQYSTKKLIIGSFLKKIFHSMISYIRNEMIEYDIYSAILKVEDTEDVSEIIKQIQDLIDIIMQHNSNGLKSVNMKTLCIYFEKLINNEIDVFFWEYFWKVFELNNIHISEKLKYIIIGIFELSNMSFTEEYEVQ